MCLPPNFCLDPSATRYWQRLCRYEAQRTSGEGLSRPYARTTELVESYLESKTYADFLNDQFLQDAVIRRIDVLGHAAKYVLEEAPQAATRFPEIPFHAIYGMRNWLTHAYFAIDEEIVWKTVRADLARLKVSLQEALLSIEQVPLQ